MKKAYFVGGLGATGKTTFAHRLAKELNYSYVQCDNVYAIVKQKLNIPQDLLVYAPMPSTWENPEILNRKDWGIYGSANKLLEVCYNELFNYLIPDNAVMESEALFYNKGEFKIVMDLFKNHAKRFFMISPDYEQWLKNRSSRVGKPLEYIPKFKDEDDYYVKQKNYLNFYMPKGTLVIKDIMNCQTSLTGGVNYQKPELLEPKWSIFKFPENMEGKSFLEIGCNAGFFLKKAGECGAKNIEGVDISWRVLDIAYDQVPEAILYLSKIENFDWEGKFYDFILCSSAFHYFTHREKIIENISKHTGYFILETPIYEKDAEDIIYQDFGDNKDFCSLPTEKLLLKWLNKYFKKVIRIGETPVENSRPRPVYRCLQ